METLGNVLLTTLWIFALICYLMILFYILSDLFADKDLSGWWKAVWIVLLIAFPFVTALVYLIVRGKGMQERGLARAQQYQQAQENYIQQAVSQTDPADQIARAKELKDSGVITDEEYRQLKDRALA